jgi:hypothetical protein
MTQREDLLCAVRNRDWQGARELLQRAAFSLGTVSSGKLEAGGYSRALWLCLRSLGITLIDGDAFVELSSVIYLHDLTGYYAIGQREAAKNKGGPH